MNNEYIDFLKAKVCDVPQYGFAIEANEINIKLRTAPFAYEGAIVEWMVRGGRRALFGSFGTGKTTMQLETVVQVLKAAGGNGLIVTPLGARQEFFHDAAMCGVPLRFIRTNEEVEPEGIHITNYESIREGKLDPSQFTVVSLDEASVLRSFGSKTFGEMLFGSIQNVPYRFVATATPSPNEYQEILAYAHFLGIMDIGQARTRFFKRNSEKSDDLTLRPNKVEEFWLWASSWSLFFDKPSDLGFPDDNFNTPELIVNWHEVRAIGEDAGSDRSGQARIFRNASIGLPEAAKEKRESLGVRMEKCEQLLNSAGDDHVIIWHDLEKEREAIERRIPGVVTVYGSQSLEEREEAIIGFSEGRIKYLGGKPSMVGSGPNFQRFCHRAIFLGIGFKFNDFIQAIHRIRRNLQMHTCIIDIIYTEGEREVRRRLERKWQEHDEMRAKMRSIVQEYGLSNMDVLQTLTRKLGIDRQEISGERFTIVNNDAVLETALMDSASVDLILTSVPFATQYEYSPNYADFGHTDDNEHFFAQMDFLSPQLLRVLKPGRWLVVHCKDRIMPSGMTHLGFQTIYYFHKDLIEHYERHGFKSMGMKTIVTDVVRENNQTNRLGYTEQCKDATRMGYGMPEYLLCFRKEISDTTRGYGDFPVIKSKQEYSRSRWQIDAHGFMRSTGNRLLSPEEWKQLSWSQVFNLYRSESLSEIYDYKRHVEIGETLDAIGRLPRDFMLLQPQSWHPDVWTDVTRMRTLNSSQSQKGKEMHLCPMQFDIADRIIEQLTMPGETVLDPFAGIGTVPLRAIELGRRGIGIELSTPYYLDAAGYCKLAEYKKTVPSLFDTIELSEQSIAA